MPLGFEEQLIENIAEFRRMQSEVLPPGYSREELLEVLRVRSEKSAAIAAHNAKLIDEELRPLLASDECMSGDLAGGLFALAERLFSLNGEKLDMGLALEIHTNLLRWARAEGNPDYIIKQLYWVGIVYQQTHHILLAKEALDHFLEAASYKEQYFSIKSKETRLYLNRCLGNVYVTTASLRHLWRDSYREVIEQFLVRVDEAMDFWQNDEVRALDPDFPWSAFISNAHQNTCTWLDLFRRIKFDNHDKKLALRIYDSTNSLLESAVAYNQFWSKSRTQYVWLASRYYVGKIGVDEIVAGLKEVFYNTADDDYSDDGHYSMLQVSGFIFDILEQAEQIDPKLKGRYNDDLDAILTRVLAYCENFPVSPTGMTSFSLGNWIVSIFSKADSDYMFDLVLKFSTFSHLPTYAHSVSVKNILCALVRHFIRHKPDVFVGFLGIRDGQEAVRRKDEIERLAIKVGLSHDIGKVSYANTVALTLRKLYDFEFRIIQRHAGFENIKTYDESINCVSDVIKGHHKWHNGTGGYPESFDNRASKYRFMIDLVSAADSIDAATDGVGRSYAPPKTIEQVAKEIQEQSPSRYNPLIGEALKNPDLLEDIRLCVTELRKEAYYEAYLNTGKK